MRALYFSFLFLLSAQVFGQLPTWVPEKDWNSFMGYLQNEQWDKSSKLAESLLKKCPKAETDDMTAAIIRYAYIISEAGLMEEKKLDQEKALKNVQSFTGHPVIMPAHTISTKTGYNGFNKIQPVSSLSDTLLSCESNMTKTEIFTFTYIVCKTAIPTDTLAAYAGGMCRIKGTLQSITLEGMTLPHFRIYIIDADYQLDKKQR